MRHSDELGELAAALSAAQAEIEDAPKDSVNPHFKSRYADLATVLKTVRPVLAKHGLSVAQLPMVTPDGVVVLTTTLLHKSGQWMAGDYPLEPTQRTPQGMGGAMTYARRYCLAAVVGIAQDDDDGNDATHRPQQAPRYEQPAPRPAVPAPASKPADAFDAWVVKAGEKLGVNKYQVVNHLAKHFEVQGDQGQKWATIKGLWEDAEERLDLMDELRRYQAQRDADAVAEISTNA